MDIQVRTWEERDDTLEDETLDITDRSELILQLRELQEPTVNYYAV